RLVATKERSVRTTAGRVQSRHPSSEREIALPLQRANTIGVDARVIPLDPPGDAEAGATEQRVPAIAFPKSDRLAAPVAGDAYGGGPGVSRCGWSCPVFDDS